MNRLLAFAGFGVVGCVCVALLPWLFLTSNAGEVSVENRASEAIDRVTVAVSGQALELPHIATGETKTERYNVVTDSHYDVSVTFRSGRTIDGSVGYVTSGMDFQDKLIVTNDAILYEPGSIRR
jgi:hypothetical protein